MCQVVKCESDLTNNKCFISKQYLESHISNNNVLKLNCGHCFYRPSFIQSFLINNKTVEGYRECPYCRKYITRVPIVIKKKT